MTVSFESEGIIDGTEYVTVLNETGDPLEYNLTRDEATRLYGPPVLTTCPLFPEPHTLEECLRAEHERMEGEA